jgi:cytochrome c553
MWEKLPRRLAIFCAILRGGHAMNKPVASILGALAIFGVVGCGATMAQKSGPVSVTAAPVSSSFPAWAYPWAPDFKAPPDDGRPTHVPDSAASFTVTQERDLFFVPDWHPGDHAPMPDIVARGRRPDVRACGSCHRAEGTGGPENASLAGLSAAYITQQMADFKSGARKFAGPQRSPVLMMTAIAKATTDAEVRAAADYFSALKPKPVIKVVEADTVPVTQVARFFYTAVANGGTEPIGRRIVEIPEDVEQFEHRDSRSRFTAYVPTGSIARGEALAKTGGSGTTIPCAGCHGPGLNGIGAIPGIAGRSPSYIVRQMYDFQQHARNGSAGELMMPVVEKLSHDDMIALAAYVSSLKP